MYVILHKIDLLTTIAVICVTKVVLLFLINNAVRRLPVLWTTTVQRNVLIVGTFVRRKILRGWRCERQRNNAGFAHVAGCRQNFENLRRIRTLPAFFAPS